MSIEEIREAVARGWCHPETKHLVMDVVLAEAISQEVYRAQQHKKFTDPRLGVSDQQAE